MLAVRRRDGVAARDAPVPALPLQDRLLRRADGRVLAAGSLAAPRRIGRSLSGMLERRRRIRPRPRRRVAPLARDAPAHAARRRRLLLDPLRRHGPRAGQDVARLGRRGRVGDQKTLFVADEDGEWLGVVGAFARVNPLEVQLISMWVDPQARGRGIAQDLIRARRRLDRQSAARRGSSCSCRRPTSPPSTSTSRPGFAPRATARPRCGPQRLQARARGARPAS